MIFDKDATILGLRAALHRPDLRVENGRHVLEFVEQDGRSMMVLKPEDTDPDTFILTYYEDSKMLFRTVKDKMLLLASPGFP